MRIAPLLTAAVAASAALAEPNADIAVSRPARRAAPGASRRHAHGRAHAHPSRRAQAARDSYTTVTTQNNQCLDIKDNNLQNGAALQLWSCTGGGNQQFAPANGRLQGANNLCVDVPGGLGHDGAHLQLWACTDGNTNQMFDAAGGAYRWAGSDLCLDVTDGLFEEGTLLQLWQCDAANTNQKFGGSGSGSGSSSASAGPGTSSAANAAPTSGSAGNTNLDTTSNFLGFPAIPFANFVALHPQIAGFADAYTQAGAAQNIAPTLLGAVSLQESSGNCAAANGGLFQFQDDAAWNAYGAGGDRYNCYDATWGGARYLRALLDENSNNLALALRAYNGPIDQGGLPAYIDDIGAWMTGAFVYGAGT